MTNNHTDKEEYRSYALTPVPPRWELQEYIAAYIQEQDEKYFAWFLHYYENTLNRNVRKLMGQFFMPEHFSDIKQACVIGMLKALRHYDISAGVPFVIYKERYAKREVMDYFRSSRTGFTAQSLAEFAKLRKAMAIWDKYDRNYTDETLAKIAEEMQQSMENIRDILRGGLLNENRADMYHRYIDSDGEEAEEEILEDKGSETSRLYFRWELYGKLWEAFDKLEYEERTMLSQRFGFCPECHSIYYLDDADLDESGRPKKKPIPQMLYTDIATDHGYSSANTAKRICASEIKNCGVFWIATAKYKYSYESKYNITT